MRPSRRKKIEKKSFENRPKSRLNMPLFWIFIALIIFGTIMIFDASVYKANETFHDSFYFLKQHILWVGIGTATAVVTYFFNLKLLSKLSGFLLIGSIIALLLVLILGKDVNGASRWFAIGAMRIQPAEIAKLAVIIYLSSILSKEGSKSQDQKIQIQQFRNKLIIFSVVIVVVLGLIVAQPDMGTAMVIAITSFLLFYISGEDRIHFIGSWVVSGVMGLVAAGAMVVESYRLDRIKTFFHLLFNGDVANPTKEGYQIQQILIGIGSSGFFGKGFGQSRQRFGYLVENTAFTDSIFAVILEELGFASALILVGLFIAILWQGLKISMRVEDKFSKLLAAGIVIWLCTQAFLNMGANVGLIPLTGIPFPFLTYGGSNTIVTLASVGLLLNISRYAKKDTK
ncbi:putative lipid II flippase FtsW [Candidatus Dojkabacteria bacterium]|jgi:cell division protein FtsW|nr:putative lipid II flippase FtsW [Candidatus Dojkabacteria bacterium]